MNCATPLLRNAATAVQQTCSRIPHLRVHILQRQTCSKAQHPRHTVLQKPQFRSQQTLANTRLDSPAVISDGPEHVSQPRSPREIFQPAVGEDILRVDIVYDIVEEGDPERILLALLNTDAGSRFVREADDVAFTKAFCALKPEYLLEPYKPVYRHMKASLETTARYRLVRSLKHRFDTLASFLDKIIAQRREAGHSFSLEIHRHLLRWAEVAGDGDLARHVLIGMMEEDQVEPDLKCYNSFFAAIVWHHAFVKDGLSIGESEGFRLRVTPKTLAMRRSLKPPRVLFKGYRAHSPQVPGLRLEALEQFRRLVSQGLQGDEASFTSVMVALGRERDLAGVKSILKSVWNVDTELLDAYDEEEVESPTFYHEGSPLRPSERLLFTVAHIFGSNNDFRMAYSLVDYISRNYNIPVPEKVWEELYEWAYVLSLQRSPAERRELKALGKIEHRVLDTLFEVMTDEPHMIQPTFIMLWQRAKTKLGARLIDATLENIRIARKMADEARTELSICYDEVLRYVHDSHNKAGLQTIPSYEFLKTRQRFLLAYLNVNCMVQLLVVTVRNMLEEKEWPGSGKQVTWARERLPKVVAEFQEYLPDKLIYKTQTGTVELNTKAHRLKAIRQANDDQLRKTGMVAQSIDHYDLSGLRRGMKNLPRWISRVERQCFICGQPGHRTTECTTDETLWRKEGPLHLFDEAKAEAVL